MIILLNGIVMFCDVVFINGICIVNESMLIGKLVILCLLFMIVFKLSSL